MVDGDRLADHAAHRVAEQHEAVPAEVVDEGQHVGLEQVEAVVLRARGMVAGPVTPEVGGDDVPAALGQPVEEVREVLLGAREPVDHQQGPAAGTRLGDLEADVADAHRPDRGCHGASSAGTEAADVDSGTSSAGADGRAPERWIVRSSVPR